MDRYFRLACLAATVYVLAVLSAWGREQLTIPIRLPEKEGEYTPAADLTADGKVLTSSRRKFRVRH